MICLPAWVVWWILPIDVWDCIWVMLWYMGWILFIWNCWCLVLQLRSSGIDVCTILDFYLCLTFVNVFGLSRLPRVGIIMPKSNFV